MGDGQLIVDKKNIELRLQQQDDKQTSQINLEKEGQKLTNLSETNEITDQIQNRISQNTDPVPPQNITEAEDEKVKDPVYDRNVSGILLPANGFEILEQEPSKFADVELQNSPEMQLKRSMSDVLSDSKWCGDSDQMKLIKAEISRLTDMQDKAEPIDLVIQYDRMLNIIKSYLVKKDKKSSIYSTRHQKVTSLMEQITNAKKALLDSSENLEQDAFAKRSDEAYNERLSDQKISKAAKTLKTRIFNKAIPFDKEELAKDKEHIAYLYDLQIKHYKKIAGSFCIREAAKKRRAEAAHMVLQLMEEKDLLSSLTVENTRSDQVFSTWGDRFKRLTEEEVETWTVSNDTMKDHKPIRMVNDAYGVIANLVDTEDLFVIGKDKIKLSYTDDEGNQVVMDDYAKEIKTGKTLSEALAQAQKLNLPLMYSDDAVRQLQTIQLVDYILGQTNRNDMSFEVSYKVQNVENVDYLVINHVKARDHYDSLGTGSPQELNRENKGQSTRELFNKQTNMMNFSDYDPKVADRIIHLDENVVVKYLTNIGVPSQNTQALKARLHSLKRALERDKKVGLRSRFESVYKEAREKGPEMMATYKITKRNLNRKASKYTYVSSALIQDDGEANLFETAKINRDVEVESGTVKAINQRHDRIRSHLNEDLSEKEDAPSLSPETKQAIRLVEKFADMSFVSVQTVKSEGLPLLFKVRKYENKRYRELLDETMKKNKISRYTPVDDSDDDNDLSFLFEPESTVVDLSDLFDTEKIEEEENARFTANLKRDAEWDKNNDILMKDMTDTLMKQEGSGTQYWLHLCVKYKREAIAKIKDVISILEKKKIKNKENAAQYDSEIEKLRFYLTEIDTNDTGNLVYDKKEEIRVMDKEIQSVEDFIDEKDTPLFLEEPSIRDVCQSGIGDCYFIAALAGVVEKDSSFIKNHIKDNGDGTVTVKLYKPKSYNPGHFKPIIVTVDKTSCFKKSGDRGANGCLWVQMYEKALVASGIRRQPYSPISFEDISGGCTEEALGYITGQAAKEIIDFSFTGNTFNYSLSADMKTTDEKTGKTEYTQEFEDRVEMVLSKLQDHIGRGDIVTAGAYLRLDGATGHGASGEGIRRGMAGKHAYTVTGLETIEGKQYVHIRNPWGRSAVETVKNSLTGKNVIRETTDKYRSATFLMEIHDFVEHIRSVSVLDSQKFEAAKNNN